MSTSEIATVLAWHDALAAQDYDTLAQLSSTDIGFGDPDGGAQGRNALREWAHRRHRKVEVGRIFEHEGVVVAEEKLSDGTVQASSFRVVDDQVTSVFRHTDLASALAAVRLTEDDLVP